MTGSAQPETRPAHPETGRAQPETGSAQPETGPVPPGAGRALSFGAVAERYDRLRPGYPAAAIDFALADAQPATVLDLGAGTGKLTSALIGRAERVLAVEPDPAMRAVLASAVPEATVLAGSAERLPLPAASVDAVLVGQAFHWFRRPQVDRELARVVRPGGVVALIWNLPDRSQAWVPSLYQAAGDLRGPEWLGHRDLDLDLFGPAEEHWTNWTFQVPGPDGLIELAHTWSWVITKSDAERRVLDARLRIVINRYAALQQPVVNFGQRTKVLRQHRR